MNAHLDRFRLVVMLSLGTVLPLCASSQSPTALSLQTAQTIQATGTISEANSSGRLEPTFAVAVAIQRPGLARIDLARLAPSLKATNQTIRFVSDGKTQHEYDGSAKTFTRADTPKAGDPPRSHIASLASVDLLLRGTPREMNGAVLTVGPETVSGHDMVLYTDARPVQNTPRGPAAFVMTRWANARTGMPVRGRALSNKNGILTTLAQVEFSDWRLNEPVSAARFVRSPPGKASEKSDPIGTLVGMAAPDFAVQARNGHIVRLSDYKGKPLILDFWATWCDPCKQSMPHLQKVYNKVKGRVGVLAVCVMDKRRAYDTWMVAKKSVFSLPTAFGTVGSDAKGISSAPYGVTALPTEYLIDAGGKIAAVIVGSEAPRDHRLEEALRKLGIVVTAPK